MTHLIIDADSMIYKSCFNVTTVDEAFTKFNSKLNYLKDDLWTDDMAIYLKGVENFRAVDFPLYKANRPKADPASIVPELYALLEEEEIGIQSDGCEADDLVRTAGHECTMNEDPFVIVGIDKDLFCDPFTYYNPDKSEQFELTQKEADFNYYSQLLTGDSTDNIKGLNRVGPKTAAKLLESSSQWKDLVIREYKERFGGDHEDVLTFVGHLIHIKRNEKDWFDIGFGDFYDRKIDVEKVGKLLGYDI
jgi:5'-3' exonuclease